MRSFEYDALWNKSKGFVDRAISVRDAANSMEFHLWAAVAIELLAKATLSDVHPTLVADPSDLHSLLTAAGRPTGSKRKTITAKTAFQRLGLVAGGFDERMERECMLMADRRNAELHSGESPVIGLDQRAWVPQFWKAANTLLLAQQRTIEEWVGEEEGQRVSIVLADAAELTRQTVVARVQRRRADFEARYGVAGKEREAVALRAAARPLPPRYLGSADAFEEAACTACGMKGWLFGAFADEKLIELEINDDDGHGPAEIAVTTFMVEEFRCAECDLHLEGRDEIAIAGLTASFEREDEREPDYEPDYGND